jgi:hypothetical protein
LWIIKSLKYLRIEDINDKVINTCINSALKSQITSSYSIMLTLLR